MDLIEKFRNYVGIKITIAYFIYFCLYQQDKIYCLIAKRPVFFYSTVHFFNFSYQCCLINVRYFLLRVVCLYKAHWTLYFYCIDITTIVMICLQLVKFETNSHFAEVVRLIKSPPLSMQCFLASIQVFPVLSANIFKHVFEYMS